MTEPVPGPAVRIHLRPGRERALLRGHPWVFSGAVARTEGPAEAPVAEVLAAGGVRLGLGFYSPHSRIRVRLLGAGVEAADRAFFTRRIEAALALRKSFLTPATTGYRVLNAEGDGLPGWTVDRFGEVLVSQITCTGLEALRGEAYAALREAFPAAAILQRNDLAARRKEGLPTEDEVIAGRPGDEAPFTEHGLAFTAELAGGQKTGFYCDQRENRRRVEELAGGRRLLDLFAHSGAFGLYALRGGARRVVAVESSPRLAERARAQLAANGFPAERLEWVGRDVFAELRERTERYALVVCDPPPLALRRQDLERGSRAYKDLNRLALARVAPGGFFLTFTCSGAVDGRLFRQILFAASHEAGVRVSLLQPLAAAPDHPVDLAHPEGEYLKGWLAWVPP